MLRTLLFSLLTWAISSKAAAQNLVLNPGFEELDVCPSQIGQFYSLTPGWQILRGSPDTYNTCCDMCSADVPRNFLGYQEAYEGDGYAGVITASGREYIQTELSSPLIPGVLTYVSMQVSPGGWATIGMTTPQYLSSGIGLRLSVEEVPFMPTGGEPTFYDTAVVFMPEVLSDTSAWRELSVSFYADSAYRYLQIGNFFSEMNTITEFITSDGSPGAYAYVDAVCVSQGWNACEMSNGLESAQLETTKLEILCTDGRVGLRARSGTGPLVNVRLLDPLGRMLSTIPRIEAGETIHLPIEPTRVGFFLVAYQGASGQEQVTRFVSAQP
jgi:hypothetical protein